MKKIIFLFTLSASFNTLAQSNWTQVITPNPSPVRNMLNGIPGTSANDIWVAGHKQTSPYFAQYTSENLTMHWHGSTWQQFQTISPRLTFNNLSDIEMVGTNDGWTIGEYHISGGGAQPQMHRWNGTSWTQQTIPNMSTSLYLN